MNKFPLALPVPTAHDLAHAIRVFVLMQTDRTLNKEQFYHMYITRQVYHEIEKRISNLIFGFTKKKEFKMKFDTVRALVICDLIDTIPDSDTPRESLMRLRDLRLELGKYTTRTLTVANL